MNRSHLAAAFLIVFSILVGTAALFVTPREEDPQIVVPLADVFVDFPGHSASAFAVAGRLHPRLGSPRPSHGLRIAGE